MPKISEASMRNLMPSKIGGQPSINGPTLKWSTSRISERSTSKTSVNPIARLLQRRPHQIDRRQRDGEEYSWAGRYPPGIDQVFARVGDDASKARRRRLNAEPKKAEDRLENHHACHVEHGDKGDRRQNVWRCEQQQNSPVAGSKDTQTANIFQTTFSHGRASGDARIERPTGQRQDNDDVRNGWTRYPENRNCEDHHRNRQLRVCDPHNDRIPPLSLETREQAQTAADDENKDNRSDADDERITQADEAASQHV